MEMINQFRHNNYPALIAQLKKFSFKKCPISRGNDCV